MLLRFLLCMYSSNGQVVDVFKTLFLKNSITSNHPTSLSKPFLVLQCLRGLHVCNFAAHIGGCLVNTKSRKNNFYTSKDKISYFLERKYKKENEVYQSAIFIQLTTQNIERRLCIKPIDKNIVHHTLTPRL